MSDTEIGFNFRSLSAFVTDGADETYDLGDVYPVTRAGWTFGWDTDMTANARSRDDTIDRRLAGVNFKANDGTQAVFRADLPEAGDYSIRLAIGDATTDQAYQYVQIRDDATPVFTVDDSNGTTFMTWDDATGTNWTEVTWPSANTAVLGAFSGTVLLNMALGTPGVQTALSMISHLYIGKVLDAIAPVRDRKLSTQQRMIA